MGADVQLHVHSAFSFLEGTDWPRQLVRAAAEMDVTTLALVDTHRVSGLVDFLEAAAAAGIKGVAGATVELAEGGRLVLLVPEPARYPQLMRLLTHAHEDHPRGAPRVDWEALERWGPGLVALSGGRRGCLDRRIVAGRRPAAEALARRLQRIFGADFYLEVGAGWLPGDRAVRRALRDLGEALGLAVVAAPEVHHARAEDFALYDILTAIRLGLPVEVPHPDRPLNAEQRLKRREETARALEDLAAPALRAAEALAERLEPPALLGIRRVPRFGDPRTAFRTLARHVWEGARRRYGERLERVRARIRHELAIIRDLDFADYFLVVEDVARFARRRGIRFAGRGSAADSVVAYCLGITQVDAAARDLLFERFLSRERAETPDIDIDFDARRRDEVAAYVRSRYGPDRVASVATYQTFRGRLAVRQVGKALGFPPEELDRLAKALPPRRLERVLKDWERIPEIRALGSSPRLREVVAWAARAEGLPRHLGTHLGGLVIGGEPLEQVMPFETSAKGVRVGQFDKRDVEALGLLKLDLLSLRTFTAVELAVEGIRRTEPTFDDARIPAEDPAVYAALAAGDSIGVFQLESPAQRALARRLQPDRYEDLVASLALIRPGPIKGNMVDPFVARRRGLEPVTYLHPELEPILRKTYGVVLFQEQVIAIASQLAGFEPGEADRLRRVMTHGRSVEEMERLGEQFKAKARARGVPPEVAEAVFGQIVGYASYGFNEAHAAAFAETAYRTAYLLRHYPGPYFAGLLNAQPMGYYPPDVLVTEARRNGLAILPVDINASGAGFEWVPEAGGIRVGLGAVGGIGPEVARAVVAARGAGPFRDPQDVLRRTPLAVDQVAAAIRVGAFDALDPDRDRWLESLSADNPLGVLPAPSGRSWSLAERLAWEYRILGFGQTAQWMTVCRPWLPPRIWSTCAAAAAAPDGTPVRVAGLAIRPHRPPTRSGRLIVFFSLLDETGLLDASLDERNYQRFGQWLFGSRSGGVLSVFGRMRRGTLAVRALAPWTLPRVAGATPP